MAQWRTEITACILVAFATGVATRAWAVTVVATQGGGPTSQQLAENIADATAGITVVSSSATTLINNGGSTLSSPRSMGTFVNGNTPSGTPLPPANDGSPAAVYAGGLGISTGVCLCTGAVTDSDASNPGLTGRGVGVEGPNNGFRTNSIPNEIHDGEIGQQFQADATIDADFERAVFTSQMQTMPPNSSDPVVLQFNVQITSPGFMRVSTVFGSDEYPHYIEQAFNDSFAILIKTSTAPSTEYENIARLKMGGTLSPFSLQAMFACGPPQFKINQVAPEPAPLPTSLHAIKDGSGNYDAAKPLYDHEFGGFTALRTWETACPLPPGTYTVKIVIHDVADGTVDAGLFVMQDSLKLYPFLPADFNLDGVVDLLDFTILSNNFQQCGKKFTDGDANGDGCVNFSDFAIWRDNRDQTGGNRNLKFDFDRDNDVDGSDFLLWQRNLGLAHCASRFEGDADGDGDVDGADLPPGGAGSILSDPCGGGGGQLMAASGGGSEELSSSGEPISTDAADLDEDGDVDYDDVQLFGKAMATE